MQAPSLGRCYASIILCHSLTLMDYPSQTDVVSESTSYNGHANYQTWNVKLWINSDEFLYNTAQACVRYCQPNETPFKMFVRCMTEGQIGRYLVHTGDGVRWDDPAIDKESMNEFFSDLA